MKSKKNRSSALISLVTLSLVLMVVACSSAKKEKLSAATQNKEKQELLNYRTSSCMGRCAVYEFQVFSDKSATIDGKLFCKVEGKHETQLTDKMYQQILSKMKSVNFFELKDVYDDKYVQDIPAVYIKVNEKGKTKSIKSRIKAPEKLIHFQTYVDSLVKVIKWEKIK